MSNFTRTFSEALDARGLTLERLVHKLGDRGIVVSVATLSYWKTGRSVPRRSSVSTLSALEAILELAPGSLVRELPSSSSTTWDPGAALPISSRELSAAASAGFALECQWWTEAVQQTMTRGTDVTIFRRRAVVRAMASETSRLQLWFVASSPATLGAFSVASGAASIQPVHTVRTAHGAVHALELQLSRPVQAGVALSYDCELVLHGAAVLKNVLPLPHETRLVTLESTGRVDSWLPSTYSHRRGLGRVVQTRTLPAHANPQYTLVMAGAGQHQLSG